MKSLEASSFQILWKSFYNIEATIFFKYLEALIGETIWAWAFFVGWFLLIVCFFIRYQTMQIFYFF